ncbi:helix-turn-helix domain-containing protein [Pseudoalteromonas 'SMAR']|uniref:helix-turn-helix domain-containing protein n=1 Tax=Pseudoalteromonas 'SMAR' TaxID=3416908 RepID=UPI003AF2800F
MALSKIDTALHAVNNGMLTPSQAANTYHVSKRSLYEALRQSAKGQQNRWQRLMHEKVKLEQSLAQINKELTQYYA